MAIDSDSRSVDRKVFQLSPTEPASKPKKKQDPVVYRAWYLANREKIMARQRDRLAANPEETKRRRKEYAKRSYDKNKEKNRAKSRARHAADPSYAKRWYEANRERHVAIAKAYRELHKSEALARQRAWAKANPDKVRAKNAKGWANKLLRGARGASKERTLKGRNCLVLVTPDHLRSLWDAQGGACYWTGVPLVKDQGSPWTVSLDRLDPDRGYEIDNIVLTSWFANRARGRMSVAEFREVLSVMAKHQRPIP